MTLVEFLRARLDEKRAWLDSIDNRTRNGICDAPGDHLWEPEAYAEVDAKRRIVDAHQPDAAGNCVTCLVSESDLYGSTYEKSPCWHLKVLALPHADHPEYDPSWRP